MDYIINPENPTDSWMIVTTMAMNGKMSHLTSR